MPWSILYRRNCHRILIKLNCQTSKVFEPFAVISLRGFNKIATYLLNREFREFEESDRNEEADCDPQAKSI